MTLHRHKTSFETEKANDFLNLCYAAIAQAGFAPSRPEVATVISNLQGVRLEIRATDLGVNIALESEERDLLTAIRAGVQARLAEIDPRFHGLAWEGVGQQGELAPNFSFAEIESCVPISPEFFRMVLHGSDLARFANHGLHFRILRQRDQNAHPVWPRINEKGSIDWFESDPQLIHRAYTARAVDTAEHRVTVDIYKHEGGPTCTWASTCPVGELVGLTGPGGGWFPEADWVLLAGDETAQPAILRMLEELPPKTEGKAILLAGAPGCETPFENQTEIDVCWLYRSHNDDLVAQVKSVTKPESCEPFFWFAGEKAQARDIRNFFKNALQLERAQYVSAAYWEQGKSNRRDA